MADTIDFSTIGKTIQQQHPQYAGVDPSTIGQLYVKKFQPADYSNYISNQNANTSLGLKSAENNLPSPEVDKWVNVLSQGKDVIDSVPSTIRGSVEDALSAKGVRWQTKAGKTAADAKATAVTDTKDRMQGLLDSYLGLSALDKTPLIGKYASQNPLSAGNTYEQQRQGLVESLAPILGPGKGYGLRLNNDVIKGWAKLFPQPGQTDSQKASNMIILDKSVRGRLGEGFDPNYLAAFGVTRDKNGKYSTGSSSGGVASNAATDVKGIINGLLNIPAGAINAEQQGVSQAVNQAPNNPLSKILAVPQGVGQAAINSMGQGVAGMASGYNQMLGQPLRGGDVAGRIVQNAKEKPVTTGLNLLPFLLAGAGAVGARGAAGAPATEATAAESKAAQASGMVQKAKGLVPQVLTKSGNAQKTTDAAQAATDTGTKIDWTKTMETVSKQVKNQLGNSKEVNDALDKNLKETSPASPITKQKAADIKGGKPELYSRDTSVSKTPNDLLQTRRQFTNRTSKSFLQQAFHPNTIQDQVDNITRKVLSDELHKAVPNTVKPDQMYSFYSSVHGDVPTWAKRVVAGYVAGKVGKKIGGSVGGDAGDLIGLLLGGAGRL